MKTVIGITVVGKDRGGVVAAFTSFVFERGGNIEKVSQNVIRGLFGMYLEASFEGGIDVGGLDRDLQGVAGRHGMEVSTYHGDGPRKNVAVFVTREAHCLEALIRGRERLKGKISVVVGTEDTLEPVARGAGIPFIAVREGAQDRAESELLDICRGYGIDLILLARYMRILTPNFVWRYPNRIINIHPSLLPAFPGAIAYAQAFERGTKIIGVTSHYVTESLDQGPIISQDAFGVAPSDTLETIKRKGQKMEASTLLRAAELHLENRLEVDWRKVRILPGR